MLPAIVAVEAAGAVFNGRFGTNGGVAFLLLLPAVLGVAAAPIRPLDGWLVVTGWLFLLRFLLPGPLQASLVLEPWGGLLWIPTLLLAAWAARGRAAVGVPLVSGAALLAFAVLTPWSVDLNAIVPAFVLAALPLGLGAALGYRQIARTALREEQARTATRWRGRVPSPSGPASPGRCTTSWPTRSR